MNIQERTLLTKELEELDRKHYLHPTSVPGIDPKMIFESGKGIYVTNTDGDRYIDGISMLWNVNLGHGQNELAEAAAEQMKKIAFSSSFGNFSNKPAIGLAEKLKDWTPEGLNNVFYTSGGSESNDTAFKLARFYWDLKGEDTKKKFISFKHGYHGVTIGAGTATTVAGFRKFAGTHMPDVYHATPHLIKAERGDRNHPDFKQSARYIIETEGADSIAGLIIEPVQGSGGVNVPPDGYLKALRELCDEFNILLIADEVITGFCRTGEKFGVDHYEIIPDLMSIAKGISSGYAQLGAVVLHDRIKEVIHSYNDVMFHGFTYSGHPTACAVALKNIEIMEEQHIVEHVKKMEKIMDKGLNYLDDKYSTVGLTRNKGLLGAFELFEDSSAGERFDPGKKVGLKFVENCFQENLILRALGGTEGKSIIAIAPPLIITESEVNKVISIIDDVLSKFKA